MLKTDGGQMVENHIVLGNGRIFVGQAYTAKGGLPAICFGNLETKNCVGADIDETNIPNPLSFAIVISSKEALAVLDGAVASAKKYFK